MRGTGLIRESGSAGSIGARRNDLFAVVIAAIGTDAMRPLGAAAVAARVRARRPKLPVRATLASARRRVPTLGNCHDSLVPPRCRSSSSLRDRVLTRARAVVQIRTAARAQALTVLAAVRRDRQLDEQRFASELGQIQSPAVVKPHVVIALELLFFIPPARSRTVGVEL